MNAFRSSDSTLSIGSGSSPELHSYGISERLGVGDTWDEHQLDEFSSMIFTFVYISMEFSIKSGALLALLSSIMDTKFFIRSKTISLPSSLFIVISGRSRICTKRDAQATFSSVPSTTESFALFEGFQQNLKLWPPKTLFCVHRHLCSVDVCSRYFLGCSSFISPRLNLPAFSQRPWLLLSVFGPVLLWVANVPIFWSGLWTLRLLPPCFRMEPA